MKKYIFVVLIISMILIRSGCCKETVQLPNVEQEKALVSDLEEKYYKLSTVEQKCDVQELLSILIGDPSLSEQETVETQLENDRMFSVDINTDNYKWSISKDMKRFWFAINNEQEFVPIEDRETAKQTSDKFVEQLDLNISKNTYQYMLEGMDSGGVQYEYVFEYGGVEILGSGYVHSNEDLLSGSYILIALDENGVRICEINNLIEVTGVLDTYHSTDFISEYKIQQIIDRYSGKLWLDALSKEYTIDKIDVIYIPSIENEESVLIPAYRVKTRYVVDGTIHLSQYYIDAFSGYIYNWHEI